MRAMILAAGEGRRMRPLSESTPKPLLPVGGVPLIERHVINLARAGITDIVVNVSYLAEKLVTFLGSGRQWGVRIQVSREPEPLETAGGVRQALPLLGTTPFLVVNGDIYSDYPFDQLLKQSVSTGAAHVVWVDNPPHHSDGDFYLENGVVVAEVAAGEDQASIAKLNKAVPLTFAGIGCYSPAFFAGDLPDKQALKPLMVRAMHAGLLHGEHYRGDWEDVGTPERLAILDKRLAHEVPSQ